MHFRICDVFLIWNILEHDGLDLFIFTCFGLSICAGVFVAQLQTWILTYLYFRCFRGWWAWIRLPKISLSTKSDHLSRPKISLSTRRCMLEPFGRLLGGFWEAFGRLELAGPCHTKGPLVSWSSSYRGTFCGDVVRVAGDACCDGFPHLDDFLPKIDNYFSYFFCTF